MITLSCFQAGYMKTLICNTIAVTVKALNGSYKCNERTGPSKQMTSLGLEVTQRSLYYLWPNFLERINDLSVIKFVGKIEFACAVLCGSHSLCWYPIVLRCCHLAVCCLHLHLHLYTSAMFTVTVMTLLEHSRIIHVHCTTWQYLPAPLSSG